MTQFEQIEKIAGQHNGYVRTADVLASGISKPVLAKFVKEYDYERGAHGIYLSPEAGPDEMYLLQLRCPNIVFSHDTALYLLGMTVRDPLQFTVTVKSGYNATNLKKQGLMVFSVKEDLFKLGLAKAKTMFGNEIYIYNPERTICDMIRSRSKMEMQTYTDGLKEYVRRRDKNLLRLSRYAKIFHVESILNRYLEVLL